jgi:hypothetical protein
MLKWIERLLSRPTTPKEWALLDKLSNNIGW